MLKTVSWHLPKTYSCSQRLSLTSFWERQLILMHIQQNISLYGIPIPQNDLNFLNSFQFRHFILEKWHVLTWRTLRSTQNSLVTLRWVRDQRYTGTLELEHKTLKSRSEVLNIKQDFIRLGFLQRTFSAALKCLPNRRNQTQSSQQLKETICNQWKVKTHFDKSKWVKLFF